MLWCCLFFPQWADNASCYLVFYQQNKNSWIKRKAHLQLQRILDGSVHRLPITVQSPVQVKCKTTSLYLGHIWAVWTTHWIFWALSDQLTAPCCFDKHQHEVLQTHLVSSAAFCLFLLPGCFSGWETRADMMGFSSANSLGAYYFISSAWNVCFRFKIVPIFLSLIIWS